MYLKMILVVVQVHTLQCLQKEFLRLSYGCFHRLEVLLVGVLIRKAVISGAYNGASDVGNFHIFRLSGGKYECNSLEPPHSVQALVSKQLCGFRYISLFHARLLRSTVFRRVL